MSIFVIGDLHLSFHENKPMSIFGDNWEGHEEKIKKDWIAKVKEEDLVILPGDFSWSTYLKDTYEDFTYLNSLPGKKILLKGNHDYWWTTRKKIEAYLKENNFKSISILFNSAEVVENFAVCGTRGWSYDCSTQEDVKILNREVGRLTMSIEQARKLDREVIVFLHYPPVFSGYECTEIMNVLREYKIKKCYYGHIHGKQIGKKAITGFHNGIDFHMISSDQVGFVPVLVF